MFKVISVLLIAAFLNLEVSWAYPSQDVDTYNLAAPRMPMPQQQLVSAIGSVLSVGSYLLGDPETGTAPLPIEHLDDVLSSELDENTLKNIDLSKVWMHPDIEGAYLVPYEKDGQKYLFQIALRDNVTSEELEGYDWDISDKYVIKILPKDYNPKTVHQEKTEKPVSIEGKTSPQEETEAKVELEAIGEIKEAKVWSKEKGNFSTVRNLSIRRILGGAIRMISIVLLPALVAAFLFITSSTVAAQDESGVPAPRDGPTAESIKKIDYETLWKKSDTYNMKVLTGIVRQIENEDTEESYRLLIEVASRGIGDHHDLAIKVLAGKQKKVIPILLKTIRTDKKWSGQRVAAVKVFSSMDFSDNLEVIEEMRKALRDDNHQIRQNSAKALRSIRWKPGSQEETIYYLFGLEDWDNLKKIGEPVIPILAPLYPEEGFRLKKHIVHVLGSTRSDKAKTFLLEALKYEDVTISGEAARQLAEYRGRDITEALLEAAWSEHYDDPKNMQYYAIESLAEIGDPKAIDPIKKLFYMNEVDWLRRQVAAQALNKLGWAPEKDIDKIFFHMGLGEWYELNKYGSTAKPYLVKILREGLHSVRMDFAKHAHRVSPSLRDAGIDVILEYFNGHEIYQRWEAYNALLEMINEPKARSYIQPLLDDPILHDIYELGASAWDDPKRGNCKWAALRLAESKDKRAIGPIKDAMLYWRNDSKAQEIFIEVLDEVIESTKGDITPVLAPTNILTPAELSERDAKLEKLALKLRSAKRRAEEAAREEERASELLIREQKIGRLEAKIEKLGKYGKARVPGVASLVIAVVIAVFSTVVGWMTGRARNRKRQNRIIAGKNREISAMNQKVLDHEGLKEQLKKLTDIEVVKEELKKEQEDIRALLKEVEKFQKQAEVQNGAFERETAQIALNILNAELPARKDRLEKLQDKLVVMEGSEVNLKRVESQKELEEMEARKKEEQKRFEEIKRVREEVEGEKRKLEEELALKKLEMDQAQEDLKKLKKQTDVDSQSKAAEIAKSRKELESLRKQSDEARRTLQGIQKEIQTKEEERQKNGIANREISDAVQRKRLELKQAEEDLAEVKRKTEEASAFGQRETNRVEGEIKKLEKQSSDVRGMLQEMHERQRTGEDQAREIENRRLSIQEDIEKKQLEAKQVASDLNELKKEYEQMQQRMVRKIEELKKELSDLEKQNHEARGVLSRLLKEAEEKEEALKEAKAGKNQLDEKVEVRQLELKQAEEDFGNLRKRFDEIQKRVEEAKVYEERALSNIEKAKQEAETIVQNANEQVKKVDEIIQKRNASISGLNKQIADLDAEAKEIIDKLTDRQLSEGEVIRQIEQKKAALQEELDQLTQQVDEARHEADMAIREDSAQVADLKMQIAELAKQEQQKRESLVEINKRIQGDERVAKELGDKKAALQEELDQLGQEVVEAHHETDTMIREDSAQVSELKKQIAELAKQEQQKRESLVEINKRIQGDERASKELGEKKAALQEELAQLTQQVDEAHHEADMMIREDSAQLSELKKQIAELAKQEQQKRESLVEINKRIQGDERVAKELEDKKAALQEELDQLGQEVVEAHYEANTMIREDSAQVDKLKKQEQQKRESLEEINKRLQDDERVAKELGDKKAALREELGQLGEQLVEARNKVDKIVRENSAQIAELRSQADDVQVKLKADKQVVEALNTQKSDLEKSISEGKKTLEGINSDIERGRKEIASLEEQIQKGKQIIFGAEESVENLKESKEGLEKEIKAFEENLEGLKKEAEEARRNREEATQAANEARKVKDDAEAHLSELKKEYDVSASRLSVVDKERQSLESEIRKAEEDLTKLWQQAIEAEKKSVEAMGVVQNAKEEQKQIESVIADLKKKVEILEKRTKEEEALAEKAREEQKSAEEKRQAEEKALVEAQEMLGKVQNKINELNDQEELLMVRIQELQALDAKREIVEEGLATKDEELVRKHKELKELTKALGGQKITVSAALENKGLLDYDWLIWNFFPTTTFTQNGLTGMFDRYLRENIRDGRSTVYLDIMEGSKAVQDAQDEYSKAGLNAYEVGENIEEVNTFTGGTCFVPPGSEDDELMKIDIITHATSLDEIENPVKVFSCLYNNLRIGGTLVAAYTISEEMYESKKPFLETLRGVARVFQEYVYYEKVHLKEEGLYLVTIAAKKATEAPLNLEEIEVRMIRRALSSDSAKEDVSEEKAASDSKTGASLVATIVAMATVIATFLTVAVVVLHFGISDVTNLVSSYKGIGVDSILGSVLGLAAFFGMVTVKPSRGGAEEDEFGKILNDLMPIPLELIIKNTKAQTEEEKLQNLAAAVKEAAQYVPMQIEGDTLEMIQKASQRDYGTTDEVLAYTLRIVQLVHLSRSPVMTDLNLVRHPWGGDANRIMYGLDAPKEGENDIGEVWHNSTVIKNDKEDHPSIISNTEIKVGDVELEPIHLRGLIDVNPKVLGGDHKEKPFFVKFLCTRFKNKVHMGFADSILKVGEDQLIEWLIKERENVEALKAALREDLTREEFIEYLKAYEKWAAYQDGRGWRFSSGSFHITQSTKKVAQFIKDDVDISELLEGIAENRSKIVSVLNEIYLKNGMMVLSPAGHPHFFKGLSSQTHPPKIIVNEAGEIEYPKNEAWIVVNIKDDDGKEHFIYVEPQQTSNDTYSFADFYTPIEWKIKDNDGNTLSLEKQHPGMRKNVTAKDIKRFVKKGLYTRRPTIPEDFIQTARDITPATGSLRAKVKTLIEDDPLVWPTKHFIVHRITLEGEGEEEPAGIVMYPVEDSYHELIVTRGEVTLKIEGSPDTKLTRGTPLFIPAEVGRYALESQGEAEVIKFFPVEESYRDIETPDVEGVKTEENTRSDEKTASGEAGSTFYGVLFVLVGTSTGGMMLGSIMLDIGMVLGVVLGSFACLWGIGLLARLASKKTEEEKAQRLGREKKEKIKREARPAQKEDKGTDKERYLKAESEELARLFAEAKKADEGKRKVPMTVSSIMSADPGFRPFISKKCDYALLKIRKAAIETYNHIYFDKWLRLGYVAPLLEAIEKFYDNPSVDFQVGPKRLYVFSISPDQHKKTGIINAHLAMVEKFPEEDFGSVIVHEAVHLTPRQIEQMAILMKTVKTLIALVGTPAEFFKNASPRKAEQAFELFRKMQTIRVNIEFEAFAVQNVYRRNLARESGYSHFGEYIEDIKTRNQEDEDILQVYTPWEDVVDYNGNLLPDARLLIYELSAPQHTEEITNLMATRAGVETIRDYSSWLGSWLGNMKYYRPDYTELDGGFTNTEILLSLIILGVGFGVAPVIWGADKSADIINKLKDISLSDILAPIMGLASVVGTVISSKASGDDDSWAKSQETTSIPSEDSEKPGEKEFSDDAVNKTVYVDELLQVEEELQETLAESEMLFNLIRSLRKNSRKARLVDAANKLLDYLEEKKYLPQDLDTSELNKKDATALLIQRMQEVLSLVDELGNFNEETKEYREKLPEKIVEYASDVRANFDQLEADSVTVSMIILGRRMMRENKTLTIGLETDWVPGLERGKWQQKAMFGSGHLKDPQKLVEMLKSMGLEVTLVHKERKESRASWVKKMVDLQEDQNDLSGIVVLGSHKTIEFLDNKVLDGLDNDKRAFLAGIDSTNLQKFYDENGEDEENQLVIEIMKMLSIALELASGKRMPNLPMIQAYDEEMRMVMFLPDVKPAKYSDLIDIYRMKNLARKSV